MVVVAEVVVPAATEEIEMMDVRSEAEKRS